jgi:hypothetical protein
MDAVKETTPREGESGVSSSSRTPYFLLSFVGHLRYICALMASGMPTSSSARRRGRGRVGNDF